MQQALTLQQVFGNNASQYADNLIIHKSDLPELIPSSTNSAESLFIALLLQVLQIFEGTITDENNNPITDENNNQITYGNDDNAEFLNVSLFNTYYQERDNILMITFNLVCKNYSLYTP